MAPAFYALGRGGWRDLLTVLHPPYTAWNLSHVAIGAAVAPELHLGRLLATIGAFFLAVGVAAHALDELRDRPLRTTLSDRALLLMAAGGLAGAVAIGVAGLFVVSLWLAPLIVAGAFFVPAYNLEWFGGRLHTDLWLIASWGAFPAFTGYFANALTVDPAAVLVALGCASLTAAQRRLSTPVRELRRRTVELSGVQALADGRTVQLDAARIAAPLDGALKTISVGMVLLAAGLVATRL